MNGLSILKSFLKDNDPIMFLNRFAKLYNSYLKESDSIMGNIKKWWIEKISYPLFRYKLLKSQTQTAELLYNYPQHLVFIVTRYLAYLSYYNNLFKMEIEEILESVFPEDMVYLRLNTISTIDGDRLDSYSLVLHTLIVPNIDDELTDKCCTTSLEVIMDKEEYILTQTVYDTNDFFMTATAPILYSKTFSLSPDGTLINPNYSLSKELLEEDLNCYRIMISQLMIFLGEILIETSTIRFFNIEQS